MRFSTVGVIVVSLWWAVPAQAEWTSEAKVCKAQNFPSGCLTDVTSKGALVTWGGKVMELDMVNGQFTGGMKVRVNWISDGTRYTCGQMLQFNYFDELMDLTAVSLAMRRCK